MVKKRISNVVKARKRMLLVEKTLQIFDRFSTLGYKDRHVICNQLVIYFPKYENDPYQEYFNQLWAFKGYKSELINDLEKVLNKLSK